ncbi:uncharacterized protein LOC112009795 [Quercus suber]|uniref:uncharacterized protein LOC112009795 n=1 Tax=Quercus suber TaxID=58331 RepID=UPI000CE1B87D|nr:uncharacterized protein LOC112009795 [Quercus suber]
MEELTSNWNRLSLSDREGPGCCLEDDLSSEELFLAAKFLTRRAVNVDAIAKTFTPLWRSRNGFQVRNLGNHMVLFVFDNMEEVEKVIQSEPWSFDKHIMILEKYDKNNLVEELQFKRTTFWVQVHGLPIKFMNVRAATKICEVLGTVLPFTNQHEIEGGNFVRIRVSLDVTIPLCRGRLVSIGRDKEVWVSFKYERLPNICYWCGCFDHDDKDCEKWLNSEGTLTPDQREFGPTLRAAPFFSSRK